MTCVIYTYTFYYNFIVVKGYKLLSEHIQDEIIKMFELVEENIWLYCIQRYTAVCQ